MTETSCSPSRERGGLCAGTCTEYPAPKDTGMPPNLRASSTCWQCHRCLECHMSCRSSSLAEKSQIQPFLLCPCMLDAWRRWSDARGKSYWIFAQRGCAFYRKPCTYSPVTWGCAGGRVSPRSQASSHRDTHWQPKPRLVGMQDRQSLSPLPSRGDPAVLVLC